MTATRELGEKFENSEEINKTEEGSSLSLVSKTVFPSLGRALAATPADNFAKRSQLLLSKPLSLKDIGPIIVQDGVGFGKMRNAYRGLLVGFAYKGLQLSSMDAMYNQQKVLEDKLGHSHLNNLLVGVGFSAVQTTLLHPLSTIRTRVQVNSPELTKIDNPKIPGFLRKSPLFGAVYQGNYFSGLKENYSRTATFFIIGGFAVGPYTNLLTKYQILGNDTEKPNPTQESVGRVLGSSTATVCSVLFDNGKTLKQASKDYNNVGMFHLIKDSIKTKGFLRTMRPGAPYMVSEGLGFVGFYAGKALAQKIEEETNKNQKKL